MRLAGEIGLALLHESLIKVGDVFYLCTDLTMVIELLELQLSGCVPCSSTCTQKHVDTQAQCKESQKDSCDSRSLDFSPQHDSFVTGKRFTTTSGNP